MFNLSPKNDKFFDMFITFTEVIEQAGEKLRDYTDDPSNSYEKFHEIKHMERRGDEHLHQIFEYLNNSFITPIDREDIFLIGKALDDILDLIEETASKFLIFNVTKATEYSATMADYVVQCTHAVSGAMAELKKMNRSQIIIDQIVEVNRIENEGDNVFRKAVKELFEGDTPARDIIIWKEIYEYLENTLDACEDLANIIEGVIMKHA